MRAIPAQAATFFRSGRIWRLIPARATKKADPKGQLCSLLFKICVITQFTYYS
jgi:hypothetical protein